jgi:mannitol-1-/sugar-/sorbitol-6-phosphatase
MVRCERADFRGGPGGWQSTSGGARSRFAKVLRPPVLVAVPSSHLLPRGLAAVELDLPRRGETSMKGHDEFQDLPMTDLSTPMPAVLARSHDAFLFDMDGTLVNSIAVVERVWRGWAVAHGLDVEDFMRRLHGVRAIDVIRRENLPGVDAEEQAQHVLQLELDDVDGIVEIAGAVEFLRQLPDDRWAIVTSAPRELAVKRMAAAGIPTPNVLICGEDVAHGKPDPEGYAKAARLLGFAPENCVVFEDAPAGVEAARTLRAGVVVITETHETPLAIDEVSTPDYRGITVAVTPAGDLKLTRR